MMKHEGVKGMKGMADDRMTEHDCMNGMNEGIPGRHQILCIERLR